MKIVIVLSLVFALIIGLGGIVGVLLPAQVDVATSVKINAKAADVFPYINDLQRWEEWTAWTKEQYPDMKRSFGDIKAGKGGTMSWTDAGGAGELEIVSSEANKGIEFDLSFEGGDPWRSTIALEEEAGVTTVTWSVKGEKPFLLRFFPMESAIKKDYDAGLEKLKKCITPEDAAAEPKKDD